MPKSLAQAARQFMDRMADKEIPPGVLGDDGYWHPAPEIEERPCCGRWDPSDLMRHCSTLTHVAALHNSDRWSLALFVHLMNHGYTVEVLKKLEAFDAFFTAVRMIEKSTGRTIEIRELKAIAAAIVGPQAALGEEPFRFRSEP